MDDRNHDLITTANLENADGFYDALFAQHLGWLVRHGDERFGVMDLGDLGRLGKFLQQRIKLTRIAMKQKTRRKPIARRACDTGDDGVGSEISPHGVDGNDSFRRHARDPRFMAHSWGRRRARGR